jgi:hypothetical protein
MRNAIALPFVLAASLLGWACSSTTTASTTCPDYEIPNGSGKCVQCLTDSDCEASRQGQACLSGGYCGCNSGNDCASNPNGSACLSSALCGCNANTDCDGVTTTCDVMSNVCTSL